MKSSPKIFRLSALIAVAVLAFGFTATAQDKKAKRAKKAAAPKGQTFSLKGAEKTLYKTTPQGKLHLHIYKPEGWSEKDSRPAIVFFFGGGWNGGAPTQFQPHCEYLASRGMVAITAEYRVRSRHKTPPADCVRDGKSAIRFVRANAAKLGVDPQRIAVGGGSAGGHVAAATGTTKHFEEAGEDLSISSKPQALALFNPVYNNGPGQWGHERVEDQWEKISPRHNIHEGMPPAIVFFGTKDSLVTPETAREFQSAMEAVGSRSALKLYEGATHGFFNQNKEGGKYYVSTVREMDHFFASLGWLKGEPTIGK